MDDKMPNCGCGGELLHKLIKQTKQHAMRCLGCGLTTAYFDSETEAVAAWTRAMSAHAPGMEAMREAVKAALEEIAKEFDAKALAAGQYADFAAISYQGVAAYLRRAALQAAERGKK